MVILLDDESCLNRRQDVVKQQSFWLGVFSGMSTSLMLQSSPLSYVALVAAASKTYGGYLAVTDYKQKYKSSIYAQKKGGKLPGHEQLYWQSLQLGMGSFIGAMIATLIAYNTFLKDPALQPISERCPKL